MRGWSLVVAIISSLIFICGCGGGGGGSSTPDPTVRFFNGSSDAGDLDFWIDDDNKAPSLSFDTATATHDSINANDYDVVISSAGLNDQLDASLFTFAKDKDYLISALGLKFYGSEPLKRLQIAIHEVDRHFLNGNVARLIVINGYNREAGFETPAIDFQNPGNNPQFKISNVGFGDSKTATITSGVQNFEVRTAGTEDVLMTVTKTLSAGKTYAVYILGQENGTGNLTPKVTFVELETRD